MFVMCHALDELLIHITANPTKTLSSGVIIPLRQEEQKVEESSLITEDNSKWQCQNLK